MVKLIEKISKAALAPSAFIGTQILKGVSLITKKDYGSTKENLESASKTTFGKVLGTAIAGTAVAAAGAAVAASSSATAIATKLIPTTTKGKVIAAVATPVAAGAIIEKPKETTKAIISLPSNLANVGANIADLATDPSLSNAVDLVKENPVIVGGAVAAAGTAAIVGVSNLVSGTLTRREMREQTAAFEEQAQAAKEQVKILQNATTLPTTTNQVQSIPATTGSSPAAASPVLPQTQTITATTGSSSTKRKKSSRKPLQSKISQSVRVNVIGVSSANRTYKKYLNTITLKN
jgi:hypothetical protein